MIHDRSYHPVAPSTCCRASSGAASSSGTEMPAERTQLSPPVAFKVAAAAFFWPQLKQATIMQGCGTR